MHEQPLQIGETIDLGRASVETQSKSGPIPEFTNGFEMPLLSDD